MRRAFRFLLIAVVVSSLGLLSARAEPRQAFHLEEHLPASTLAFVSLDNLDQAHARWEKTAMGRMFADEEMQAFFAPIIKQLTDLMHGQMDEVPPSVMQLLEHLHGVKGQVAIGLVDIDPKQEKISAAMSVDFGDSPEQFVAFLEKMRKEMDPEGRHVKMSTKDGRWWLEADLDEVTLHATTHGTTLIASTDEALLKSVLAGESSGLGASSAFQTVRTRCGGDELALFTYANVGSAFEKFADMMPPEAQGIGTALGLDTVHAVAYGMAFHGDGFRDTIMVHAPGADHGIIPVIRMKPLTTPRTLDLAPAGSFDWFEANLNWDEIIPNVRALVQKIDPDATTEMDDGLEMVAQMLGVDIEKELLAGLQGSFGYYMTFPPAGGLYPEAAVIMQLKDGAGYEGVFGRLASGLAGLLNEEGDVIASVRELDYHGTTMHLFEMQAARGDDPVPFTPTWAVMGDRLVITLVPYTMKEVILRASGRSAVPTLASKEDFQALMAAKPADAGSMEYVDLKSAMGLLYGTAVPLVQTVLKPNVMEDLPIQIDWAQLPPASRMSSYFRSMASFGTWNEDGMVGTIQAPVPMLPIVMAAAGSAMFLGFSRAGMMSAPAMEYAVPQAPRAMPVPESDLDREMDIELAKLQAEIFAEAVQKYRIDRDQLPGSLDDLVKADYISTVSKDPWGMSYTFQVMPDGGFAVVSAGPDKRMGTRDDLRLVRK